MARPQFKKLEIKKITRIINVGVILLSLGILGLSGWFLSSALNEEGAAAGADSGPAIETLNLRLLELVRNDLEKKKAGGDPLPSTLRNPFVRTLPAPPPAPPSPEPPPAPPAPPTEPPTEPPPPPAT